MQTVVMVLVAAAAVAAVFYPLLKKRPAAGSGDFDLAPPAAEPRASERAVRPRAAAGSDDPFEAEVLRYREALRAGTVCASCRQANPPGSRFCYECGQPLDTPPDEAPPET